jgi:ADP-dependent phosphofructokinase/glucokinase
VVDFTEGNTCQISSGEKYGELHCPRTNRLFLQSDIDNMRFPGLDKLDVEVSAVRPDVFVISGFQLMNQRDMTLID